jgi:hypothetical protein
VTNEPTPQQVARFTQLRLKSEVKSRNQNEWALDNVDGFYERTHAALRPEREPNSARPGILQRRNRRLCRSFCVRIGETDSSLQAEGGPDGDFLQDMLAASVDLHSYLEETLPRAL